MDAFSRTSDGQWSAVFVNRCQQLAGGVDDFPGSASAERLRRLTINLPGDLTIAERLVIRSLLTTLIARITRAAGVDQHQDVLAIFFDWAACDIASSSWRDEVDRFVRRCADALGHHSAGRPGHCIDDFRIMQALQMIESCYQDSTLSIRKVASQAGLSVGHTARLMKRFTGCGFTKHLHRTRIAAARRLLRDPSLRVKEITTAVGYSTSSQFCWHFKRLTGTTPARYRIGQR